MTALAVVAFACAAELGWPSGSRRVRWRLGLAARQWTLPKRPLAALAGVLVVMGLAALGTSHLFVVLAGAVGGGATLRVVTGSRARTVARGRRRDAVEALSLVAAELRSGAMAESALRAAADEVELLAGAARAASHGADVVAALRAAGERAGAEVLDDLASAWWLADRAGAPLAGVLTRLADRARDDLDLAAEVDAELAPARATARLMAVLPVFGLALGSGMGGDPVHVLLATPVGGICLLLGVAFASAGVLWVERVATAGQR